MHTPVSIYLKIRDKFAKSILLESSDYRGSDNSFSYICLKPIASFEVSDKQIKQTYPDGKEIKTNTPNPKKEVLEHWQNFTQSFQADVLPFSFIYNGLFGYTTYDAVQYFEDIHLQGFKNDAYKIPSISYHLYQYIIAINHFKNELYIFEHSISDSFEGIEYIEDIINHRNIPTYHFRLEAEENSNLTEEEFIKIVDKGREHCKRGDVFQIVLSRQFSQNFQGDDFNVYRALRSINPSPYLFYFDFGSFRIFGSSPEAQLVVNKNKATIHPIAGTFKRTGDDQADSALAQQLSQDEKETAEHVMLVDLARNDLSRNGENVRVESFKEIQYYSHLIHLVSKVSADINPDTHTLQLFADTFPAGTLSGAPKYKAMTLINQYENQNRGFYGGAIGFMSFNGDLNHAIMIRTFLSKNNTMYYQAGAGVVFKSVPQSELEEVNHKLSALKAALKTAETL